MTVNVVLPLGDHQVNSVEVVEIHKAVLPLWAIFVRYSEQQMKYCLHVPMICLKLKQKRKRYSR